ncbi:MAG: uroporphyrinogen decarboxylase family protein [Phycisphaerae bacterium]
MAGRDTDHANLDLTQLHLDVVRGRAGGKVIWQPRIGAWLSERRRRGEPLPEPYDRMSKPEIYRSLGVSNRIYDFNRCFVSHEDERVRTTTEDIGNGRFEVRVETPAGVQRAVYETSPNSSYKKHIKWPIADEQDMRVAAWRQRRLTWTFDRQAYDRLCDEWSGLGAPTMYMPRTTVQKLYIDEMGVENAIFALMDYGDTCEAYFEALQTNQEQLIEVINDSPVEVINFGDNVHSGTLPPEYFARYVLPVYQRRCELLHDGGKFVHAHFDGDTRPLLPMARDTGLDGIEAITPQPQGDVTLEEVKEALGDELFLIDGIPAVYFDKTYDEQTLIDCARRVIELFAPRLILGISDEISWTGDIERIRLVTQVVDDYNASL